MNFSKLLFAMPLMLTISVLASCAVSDDVNSYPRQSEIEARQILIKQKPIQSLSSPASELKVWYEYGQKRIVVDSSTSDAELASLCQDPTATLDITNLDLSRLPVIVDANIYSAVQAFDAPQLESVGILSAPEAKSFSIPYLQEAVGISVHDLEAFKAPNLRSVVRDIGLCSGKLGRCSSKSFDAPQLRIAGSIGFNGPDSTSFNAPNLERASLNVYNVMDLKLPKLKIANSINANSAHDFYAPQLRVSYIILAENTVDFDAPQLEFTSNIILPAAINVNLPQLQSAEFIRTPVAINLNAPNVQVKGNPPRSLECWDFLLRQEEEKYDLYDGHCMHNFGSNACIPTSEASCSQRIKQH